MPTISTKLTESDQKRLAEIRMRLERDRALGMDVESWEATFFFGIIDTLLQK